MHGHGSGLERTYLDRTTWLASSSSLPGSRLPARWLHGVGVGGGKGCLPAACGGGEAS